jgi:integrase
MAPRVAEILARLGQIRVLRRRRQHRVRRHHRRLPRRVSASKRYRAALERAALRPLRFHDLRHTFGTRVIGVADIHRVQEWMGHANVQTTMQYLHYVPGPHTTRRSSEKRSQQIRPDGIERKRCSTNQVRVGSSK